MRRGHRLADPVVVHFQGRDGQVESMWCDPVDLARHLYRLDSIPFMRARPSYRDVIVATPDREDVLVYRRVHKSGGFRTAALEYSHRSTFRPLVTWLGKTFGAEAEGCVGPTRASRGFVAIAVPVRVAVGEVISAAVHRFPGVADPAAKEPPPTPPPVAGPDEALHAAVAKGEARSVKRAIADGAKVHSRVGPAGDPALVAAAKKPSVAVVRALLDGGATPGAKNDLGQTAAYWAIARGDVEMLNVLLAAGASPVTRDKSGWTGFQKAVAEGRTSMVKRLLALGVDPNARGNGLGSTPLLGAAMRDRPQIAALLLAAGARVDHRDRYGSTPLMVAASRRSVATARVLIAGGAKELDEALLAAADEGCLPIVKLLIEAGADPEHRSLRGNAALSLARKKKHRELVEYLVKIARRADLTGPISD